jgi:hypothetical protein
MTDAKRDEIKTRINQAQARDESRREHTLSEKVGEQAAEAKDKFVAFAKEHPVATVAGGLVLGIVIAGMFKAPRRAAREGGARAIGLAAIGSEIAMAFASQLLEGAQDAGRSGVRKAESTARNLRNGAAHGASDVADAAHAARVGIAKRISSVLERR